MRSYHLKLALAALGLLFVPAAPRSALATPEVEVTCTVQGSTTQVLRYVLNGDLDCTGQGAVLQLDKGDRLELRGHTLTGLHITAGLNVKVFGPGTITGGDDGIRHSGGLLTVRDATVAGNARYGIVSLAGKIKLLGATVTGNGIDGVAAFRSVVLRDSTVTGNARFGVSTRPDGTAPGGAPCSETAKATIKAEGSTVTGNGTGGDCGTVEACADLATCGRVPKIKATTCDHSYLLESGVPGSTLGVCNLD